MLGGLRYLLLATVLSSGLVSCQKKEQESASAPASASASPATGPGPSSAPPASAAPSTKVVEQWVDDSGPATMIAPSGGRVEVKRRHSPKQRYRTNLDLDDTVPMKFGGLATVTSATDSKTDMTLFLDRIQTGTKVKETSASFLVTVDGSEVPTSVDAKPRHDDDPDDKDVLLHMTMIEHLVGSLCEPPKGKHKVGEQWTANGDKWRLAAYEKIGDEEFATYDMSWSRSERGKVKTSWKRHYRVSVKDGFTGTCVAENANELGALGTKSQLWTLTVKRAATTN